MKYVTDTCLLALLLSLTSINLTILLAHQRIKENNLINIIQISVVLIMLFVFFIVLKKRTIEAYLYSLYTGYGISLATSYLYTFRYYLSFTRENTDTWLKALKGMSFLGFFNQIAVFTQLLSFRFGYYILNYYFGTNDVEIYSNGVSIAESVWLISRSIGMVQNSTIVNSTDNAYSLKLTENLLWKSLLEICMCCFCSCTFTLIAVYNCFWS